MDHSRLLWCDRNQLKRVFRYFCNVFRIGPTHDDDDDDNMTWACEVAAMRLLKKCKKETLIMLCNDFGIPTSGNKEKLAEEAAEQLHYETDDSDDEDDDQ